jgi:hypothetical protein
MGLLNNIGAKVAKAATKARKQVGEALDTSYRGVHEAPDLDGGAPLYDLTKLYPDDVYSSKAAQYYSHYGGDHPLDREAINKIQAYRNHPDKPVTIYRAVPKDAGNTFNAGDWVTITRDYAKEHGESTLEGDYKIIKKTVSARDLFTEANSIHEWGYAPQPYKQLQERAYNEVPPRMRDRWNEIQESLSTPDLSKFTLGGAGLMGAASLYSPQNAQALQYRNMAEQQALQEPTFDPTNLIAPGGLMGNIGGEGISALMKYLSNQRMNTESGI